MATSALTGALAGSAGGVAWSLLLGVPLNGWALAALVACVLALDLVPAVPPLSVARQVPQLWGRIFSPRVVAVLYGARLGVGPLTILRTWLWWGCFLAGASAGWRWAALVGAVFGASRGVAMLSVGVRAGSLQPRERTVSMAVAVAVVVVVAALAVAVDVGAGPASAVPRADASSGRVIDPSVDPTTTSSSTSPIT